MTTKKSMENVEEMNRKNDYHFIVSFKVHLIHALHSSPPISIYRRFFSHA